jgi:integrase
MDPSEPGSGCCPRQARSSWDETARLSVAPKASGEVIEWRGRQGLTFAIRFRAYGRRHYLTLGTAQEGWTRHRAEEELANVLADARRGIWCPPERTEIAEPTPEPGFHEFSSQWFDSHRRELEETSERDYRWRLSNHLLPYFRRHRLSEITLEEVDRYRQAKVREGRLGAESINKTLGLLAQILEVAVEYGYLERNPARGKRRRLKVKRPTPIYLDTADQIVALLDAARELDARPMARTAGRRALVAALVFAGPRAAEVGAIRVRDVDLSTGRITIADSKTPAGVRRIEILPVLRDELVAYKADLGLLAADAPMFPTATGKRRDKDNIRQRVMEPVVERANELLAARDLSPLPEGLTAHKLRHTFGSLLAACGEDPAYIMAQLGHTDPKFTLRVYTHLMRRRDGERGRLRALVEGAEWAEMGRNRPGAPAEGLIDTPSEGPETVSDAGDSEDGRGWFRTSDLSRVKRAVKRFRAISSTTAVLPVKGRPPASE